MVSQTQDKFHSAMVEFKHKTDTKHPALTALYRRKNLGFFYAVAQSLHQDVDMGISIDPYLRAIYNTLVDGRRYLDLASFYAWIESDKEGNKLLASHFKTIVLNNISGLFEKSLTYNSLELDAMFVDVLDNNREHFFRLMSSVFQEHKLFQAELSDNMWKAFIDVADTDFSLFVTYTNTHFLAFYLNNVTKLPFVSEKHIEAITTFLLSTSTSTNLIRKVISAMMIAPSVDILLIMLLMAKTYERGRILTLLKKVISDGDVSLERHKEDMKYFISQAFDNALYSFHTIPGQQKTMFADLILSMDFISFVPKIIETILDTTLADSPKVFETRKISASLLAHLFLAHKNLKTEIVALLRNKNTEPEIKKIMNKVIKDYGYAKL